MRTIKRTVSLPIELDRELHTLIKKMELSNFVSECIKKGLADVKKKLLQEYSMAENDEGQKEARSDWQSPLSDESEDETEW